MYRPGATNAIYDRAIADYTEAIRLYPKFVNSYTNRAFVWHDKGELDRAIADFKIALALGYEPAREHLIKLGVTP